MKVVSATVEYGRTVKPADYESKSAKISLTIVPMDEDSFITQGQIDEAGAMAQAKALELVGLKPAKAAAPEPVDAAKSDAAKQAYAEKESAKEAAKKPAKAKKAEVVDEEIPFSTAPTSAAKTAENTSTNTSSAGDDLASELEGLDEGVEQELIEVTYTPDDLTKAVHAKVKKLKDEGDEKAPGKVGAVLAKFNTSGAKIFSDVCKAIVKADKAKDFLAALEEVA